MSTLLVFVQILIGIGNFYVTFGSNLNFLMEVRERHQWLQLVHVDTLKI